MGGGCENYYDVFSDNTLRICDPSSQTDGRNTGAEHTPSPGSKGPGAISKRVRFEIFKRDSFTCLYCGSRPPEVVLEIDHVIPISKGGTSDPCNLATSCNACNNGKRNIPLEELPHKHLDTLEERREKLDQLKAIMEMTAEQLDLEESAFRVVSDYWIKLDEGDPSRSELAGEPARAVRRFLKTLPLEEVLDSVSVAFHRFGEKSGHTLFKYFCGICWKKIKERNSGET